MEKPNVNLKTIQKQIVTVKWKNGKAGQFEYSNDEICYRFVQCDANMENYLVSISERNAINTPVLINGFSAYFIKHLGMEIELICKKYFDQIFTRYWADERQVDYLANRQNKLNEFASLHRSEERKSHKASGSLVNFIGYEEQKKLDSVVEFYFNWIEKIIQPNNSNKPPKKKKEPITYQWKNKPDEELPELYNRLIDGGFIAASQTSQETFKACFAGQPARTIPDKLRWLKGGTSGTALLAYFLDSLVIRNKIPADTQVWSIAAKFFDGYTRKALSQAKYQYLANTKTYGKPNDHSLIDEVLNNL